MKINIKDIKNKIKNKKKFEQFDTILCINRGGLVPSSIIANEYNIRNVVNINVMSYTDNHEHTKLVIEKLPKETIETLQQSIKFLIVDDIIDTGLTLEAISEQLDNYNLNNYNYYTIISKKSKDELKNKFKNKFISSFYDTSDNWIYFEWEKDYK